MCYNHKLTGFVLMTGTAVFTHVYTAHFGYNWLPASPAELACDIIALAMLCISIRILIGVRDT